LRGLLPDGGESGMVKFGFGSRDDGGKEFGVCRTIWVGEQFVNRSIVNSEKNPYGF